MLVAPPSLVPAWAPSTGWVQRPQRHKVVLLSASAAASAAASHRLCSQRVHRRQKCHRRIPQRAEGKTDEVKERFMDWMRASSITTYPKLDILPDSEGEGRCVVCTKDLEKGEVLVRLPAAAAVSVTMDDSKPSGALECWWMRHPRSSIRLAAQLVSQRESFGPYIEMLYPLDQIYAPWLWPEKDLKFLPQRLADSALARKKALEKAYEDLEREGLSAMIPRDLFLRAHHAAASRAFSGEGEVPASRSAALAVGGLSILAAGAAAAVGVASVDVAATAGAAVVAATSVVVATSPSPNVLSLLPMVDQVNHRSGAPPDLQFDPTSRIWELRATRSYKPGEEIVFSYGDKDSDALLLQHGFVEEDNRADLLRLTIPEVGTCGLSAEVKAEMEKAGIQELCFDGSLEQLEVSKPSLMEAVQATLRCAAKECRESDDEKVAKEVSSTGIGRVLLRWRQERRKLLRAAAKEWQVDLFS